MTLVAGGFFFSNFIYICMDSKLLKYVRSSYLFCLGDLCFQTVEVLRVRVTTDIIVIYSPIPVELKMGAR